MTSILINGCNGKMGHVVERMCAESDQVSVLCGVDAFGENSYSFPVFSNLRDCNLKPDCVIDFSNPSALPDLLDFAGRTGCALVLATTGYSEDQIKMIEAASKNLRIFRSANMSLGINVMLALLRQAAKILGSDYDMEIVEKHHNRKLDAPSGTALMLADALSDGLAFDPEYVFERQSVRRKRDHREIGISAVRGGTIVGEHEVIFAGTDEVLEFKHTAYSREIFANGAIRAAQYISGLSAPGLYNMENLVSEVI